MNDSLLVVTTENDVTATLVVNELAKRNARFFRLDTNTFQRDILLTLDLDAHGVFDGAFHLINGKSARFSDVGLVWYRRIGPPSLDPSLDEADPQLKNWVSEECEWGFYTAMSLFTVPVVNPFSPNNRIQTNKFVQMREAARLGFEIPLSRITNNLSNISEFWKMCEKEMIFKKIRRGLCTMSDGRRLLVHTSRISEEKITEENVVRMRFNPMFFQRHIPKKYDIRSVVVGDRVFSFAIHSQEIEEAKIDYRSSYFHGGQKAIRHEHISLGCDVDKRLVSFVKIFGNHFGVIDLIQTPDERLVFLEDNPEGQWGWLEQETGAPVASTTAEYLLSIVGSQAQ